MSPPPNKKQVELKPWPFNGYAPGRYTCRCAVCEKLFTADKGAVSCLECAVLATKRTRPSPPVEGLAARLSKLLPVLQFDPQTLASDGGRARIHRQQDDARRALADELPAIIGALSSTRSPHVRGDS